MPRPHEPCMRPLPVRHKLLLRQPLAAQLRPYKVCLGLFRPGCSSGASAPTAALMGWRWTQKHAAPVTLGGRTTSMKNIMCGGGQGPAELPEPTPALPAPSSPCMCSIAPCTSALWARNTLAHYSAPAPSSSPPSLTPCSFRPQRCMCLPLPALKVLNKLFCTEPTSDPAAPPPPPPQPPYPPGE